MGSGVKVICVEVCESYNGKGIYFSSVASRLGSLILITRRM